MAGPCPPGFWRWAALMLIVTTASVTGQGCNDALGVEDSTIPDGSITASSALPDRPPHDGRLNSNSYWAAGQDRIGEWLQIFAGTTDARTAVENELENPVYARYVRFVVQDWNMNIAMRFEVEGCTVPGLSGLTLDDVGADRLTVDWTVKSGHSVSSYTLSYEPAGGTSVDLTPAPVAGDTSAAVTGLDADTDYTITLTSFDSDNLEIGVISGTFRTGPRLSDLTLDRAEMNSLTVSWKVLGDLQISRYSLRYELAGGSDSHQELSPAPGVGDTSATVSGLLFGKEYTLTLTSIDDDNQANTVISGTYKTVPRLSGLTLEDVGTGELTVSWAVVGDLPISRYSLSYREDGTASDQEVDSPPAADATSATVTGLTDKTDHILTLTSFDDNNQPTGVISGTFKTCNFTPAGYPSSGLEQNYCRNPGGLSGVFCFTTDPDTRWDLCDVPVCALFSKLTLEVAGINSLTVSWEVFRDLQISGYKLTSVRADDVQGSYQQLVLAHGDTSATVTGLLVGTEYILEVGNSLQAEAAGAYKTAECDAGYDLNADGRDCVVCQNPLGMESGAIPDSSITASSFADGKPPKDARLNGNSAWVPENDRAGEWLQVDLGEMMRIDGAITQGHSGSWVTEYVLQYSADGTSFTTHVGSDGSDKIFTANADDSTPVANLLNNPVEARYMRFVVQSWSDSGIALKLEIWGCNTVPRLSGLTLEDVGLNLDNDDQTDDDQLTVSWEVVGNLPISRYSLSYSLGYSLSYSLSYSYPLDQEVGSPPTADATSATVPGLQADTDYIIRLTSFDDTDQPTGVVSGTFKTAPRLSGLTLDRAGINSLTVSWKVFGNLPTSSFILSYQLADGSDSSADLPTPPAAEDISATVSGLLVGREYTITLTSKDESSQTNAEISGTYKTAENQNVGNAAGAQIDSYSLSYEPADGTGTSEELNSAPEPGDISATVSGLLPYTRYILTLNSTDPDRQNGHTIGTFRTESVISGLTLIRAGIDDLEVSWTKDASAQIDSYSLSYEPADGTGTSVDLNSAPGADDISATVPGLLPYTSYVITLTSSDQGRENGVTPDDRLNFGLSVTSPLDNVELFARDCVSTPSTDPNDSPRVDIIVDGCQVAETLEKDNERSNDTALYYTVAAFGFPNSIEQNLVYFHCTMIVCFKDNPNSRCSQGCISSVRGRRDTSGGQDGRVRRHHNGDTSGGQDGRVRRDSNGDTSGGQDGRVRRDSNGDTSGGQDGRVRRDSNGDTSGGQDGRVRRDSHQDHQGRISQGPFELEFEEEAGAGLDNKAFQTWWRMTTIDTSNTKA
uniref:Uncharacterized protein n=1 Tax=Branchiostoma floridae TaxID=7739 RepID=C3YP31_BRAFL|eukprot:XP_002601910.1 hypothetical protein BRAFLDRAFT_86394 [Branchiostoma floridae]